MHAQSAGSRGLREGNKGRSEGDGRKQMISEMICMGILLAMAVLDIRCHKIPIRILILANVSALIYQVVYKEEEAAIVIGGIAVGCVFVLISKVTEESLGYGDSLGILGLGVYLGFWNVLEVLSGAFFITALAAVFALIRKRMSRKCAMPFYPFLAVSYVIWVVMGIEKNM